MHCPVKTSQNAVCVQNRPNLLFLSSKTDIVRTSARIVMRVDDPSGNSPNGAFFCGFLLFFFPHVEAFAR